MGTIRIEMVKDTTGNYVSVYASFPHHVGIVRMSSIRQGSR
jgi:hypothetical protein